MQTTVSDDLPPVAEVIARLGLEPHPEGGWYREVFRSGVLLPGARGPRAAVTSIYFLLERRQYSRWHVVTSDEIWQAARSLGDYTLMSCDVAPGFDFEDFAFVAALPDHEAAFVGELATWRGLL